MALSFRAQELAECILHLSSDDVRAKTVADLDAESLQTLVDQFYAFSDAAGPILIEYGLGDKSLDSLWPSTLEYCWLCVRMGDGVDFGDDPWLNADLGRKVSAALNAAARAQGMVETYLGDDGKVYILA